MTDPPRKPGATPAAADSIDPTAGPPGVPRWVKVSAIVAGIVALAVVAVLLVVGSGGEHGPSRHGASGTGWVHG